MWFRKCPCILWIEIIILKVLLFLRHIHSNVSILLIFYSICLDYLFTVFIVLKYNYLLLCYKWPCVQITFSTKLHVWRFFGIVSFYLPKDQKCIGTLFCETMICVLIETLPQKRPPVFRRPTLSFAGKEQYFDVVTTNTCYVYYTRSSG